MTALTLADLRPGDLMFGPIGGFVPGVLPVGAGQVLLATRKDRLSWRRWWKVRHVGVVVEQPRCRCGKPEAREHPECAWHQARAQRAPESRIPVPRFPRLVQAMPHGAEEIEMTAERHWTAEYVYIRPRYRMTGSVAYGGMTERVVAAARGYVGTPYNFLTYGALAASALRLPISRRVLRKWISTRHDMMCSQLADQALADAGFHVFDDGRLPQDVVPAELFRKLLSMPGQWLTPGLDTWQDNYAWPVSNRGRA